MKIKYMDKNKTEQKDIKQMAHFIKVGSKSLILQFLDNENYRKHCFNSEKSKFSFRACNVIFNQYVAGRAFIHNQLIKSINI